MKITYFTHTNVNPDGTFPDKLGAVVTKGGVRRSSENGGCGLDNCDCSEGHWICMTSPRTDDGLVEGVTIKFENKDEMNEWIENFKHSI